MNVTSSEVIRGVRVDLAHSPDGRVALDKWQLVDTDQFLAALTLEERCFLMQKVLTKLLLPQPNFPLLLQGERVPS